MKYIAGIFLLVSVFRAEAQFTYEMGKAQYPEEMAVYTVKRTHIKFDIIKDSVVLSSENYEEMLHLNDKSNIYSEEDVQYSTLIEATDIEARTLIPNNKKFKTLEVKKFSEKDVMERGVFHGGYKSKYFVFPSVQEGAITILKYKLLYKDPRLLGSYIFSSKVPVVFSEYKVTYHNKLKIDFRLLGVGSKDVAFAEVKDGKYITATWSMKNVPRIEVEEKSPSPRSYVPQIFVFLQSGQINGKDIVFTKNEADVYNWCYKFITPVNKSENISLKALADSITAGLSSDYEKSKKIFYWVQDNIKYIAFEEGYEGYIPRKADQVCLKKYGDCKDMANVLVYMHQLVGLNSFHTWIGTRDLPYSLKKTPGTINFNHMIACVKIDTSYYFLDATGRYQKYGFPTSMIQGKEGLIGIGKDNYKILNVPETKKEENVYIDTMYLSYKENHIMGYGKKYFTGYPKIDMTYALQSRSREAYQDFVQATLSYGNNKCSVKKFDINNIDDRDMPLVMNFEIEIPDYIKKMDNELYVNLNLSKDLHEDDIDTRNRTSDYNEDYKYIIDQVFYFDIPQGYTVSYLPKNAKVSEDKFGYSIDYSIEKNKIRYKKRIYLDFLLLDKNFIPTWNKMIQSLNIAYKENILLTNFKK